MVRAGTPALLLTRNELVLGVLPMASVLEADPERPVDEVPHLPAHPALREGMSLSEGAELFARVPHDLLPCYDAEARCIGGVTRTRLLAALACDHELEPEAFGGRRPRLAVMADGEERFVQVASLLADGAWDLSAPDDFETLRKVVVAAHCDAVVLAGTSARTWGQRLVEAMGRAVSVRLALLEETEEPAAPWADLSLSLNAPEAVLRERLEQWRAESMLPVCLAVKERQLRFLAAAVRSSSAGITITDPEGIIRYCNEAEARMHGYAHPAELVGRDVGVFAPKGRRRPLSIAELASIDPSPRETWNARKDGSLFPVRMRVTPVVDARGRLLGKIAVSEDRSDVHSTRVAFARVQHEIGLLLDLTDDAIVVSAEDRTILWANAAFSALFGRQPDRLRGRRCDEVVPGDVCSQEASAHALRRTIRDAQGRERVCTLSVRRYVDPLDGSLRVVHALRDVTDLLRARHAEELQRSLEHVQFVFSSVRHEVGNPLNTIMVTAQTLRSLLLQEERDRLGQYVDWILGEGHRIERLLRALKTFSLFERVDARPGDLVSFLEALVQRILPVVSTRGIHLHWSSEPATAPLVFDPAAMNHLVENLVFNAVEAIEAEGGSRIELLLRQPRNAGLQLVVRDDGPGIAPEHLDDVFKPFFSMKRGGSGLGLSLVQRIALAHGWTVRAERNPEKGVSFHVELRAEPT